jgi:hypothetical protein
LNVAIWTMDGCEASENVAAYEPTVETTLSSETLLAIEDLCVKPLPEVPTFMKSAAPKISSLAEVVVDAPVEAFAVVETPADVASSGATGSRP